MKKLIFLPLSIAVFIVLLGGCQFLSLPLPEGEYIKSVSSPNNAYIVKAYLCANGATDADSVRCEVIETSTRRCRNIFWQHQRNDVEIKWINNTVVSIDDIKLDMENNEYYDWREYYSIDNDAEYWDKYFADEDLDNEDLLE